MNPDIQMLSVRIGYSPGQADCLFDYLECHRVENGGRYKLEGYDENDPDRFLVIIYTHPWVSPAAKDESTIICIFRFNASWPGIEHMSVALTFDWDAAWAELAVIEQAALGEILHGRRSSERRKIRLSTPLGETESDGILAKSRNQFRPNVNLSYSPADFDRLLAYIQEHCCPFSGRYDLPFAMREVPECELEVIEITVFSDRLFRQNAPPVRTLCTLRFHRGKQGIDFLLPGPNLDIETAWAELAILEQDALGRTIHGRQANGDQSVKTV